MKNIALVFLVSILLFSCTKEEAELVVPTRSIEFTPEFNTIDLTDYSADLESNNSSAYNHIMTINNLLNIPVSLMSIPTSYSNFTSEGARTEIDSSYSFSWGNGAYSVDYAYSYNNEVLNYTYLAYLNDQLYYSITGFQNTDGSQGGWSYDLNYAALGVEGLSAENFTMNFYWQMTDLDNYTFNMYYDFGTYNWAFNMSIAPGSGSYSQSNNGQLLYQTTWSADAGSYIIYNSDGSVSSETIWE